MQNRVLDRMEIEWDRLSELSQQSGIMHYQIGYYAVSRRTTVLAKKHEESSNLLSIGL